jgi:hypothetical protein
VPARREAQRAAHDRQDARAGAKRWRAGVAPAP